jgi:Cdc6-like AAA superfamily ATPase
MKKNLLFLCGPNGIGKTTISKEIVRQLPNTAYVDSDPCRYMNPFVLGDETIPTIAKNISDLIVNYMNCPVINNVVFSYGFHGRRKEVFEIIMAELSKMEHNFIPYLLWCSEEENIKRMHDDSRSPDRMQRAISESRNAYNDITYPKIDITNLSAAEAAKKLIQLFAMA